MHCTKSTRRSPYPESGDYHLMRGRILLEQSRLEQSLQSLTTALEKNPQLADSQYYAGVIYQALVR